VTVSLANSSPSPSEPVYRKPRADLYTVLLLVALLAMIAGCLCLYYEAAPGEYGDKPYAGAPSVSASAVWTGGLAGAPAADGELAS
jgi:hypothetical protein